MNSEEKKLLLAISNVKYLQPGLFARHIFDTNGGIVGSGGRSSWVLSDESNQIGSEHFEIFFLDNAFCLKDLSGKTYINGSDMPIGPDLNARLKHKDVLVVGRYKIDVFLDESDDFVDTAGYLEQMANSGKNEILDELDDLQEDFQLVEEKQQEFLDPILELEKQSSKNEIEDLNVLEDESYNILADDVSAPKQAATLQADSEFELTSSLRLKRILGFEKKPKKNKKTEEKGNRFFNKSEKHTTEMTNTESSKMDELNLEMLENELGKKSFPEDKHQEGQNHLVMGPLFNGLHSRIGENASVEEIHKLSEEIGSSLRACIQGILDIHNQVENGRFGVVNRNLQPIEDNPLRLGLAYDDTMKTLFDNKKSIVHLSAPSAIEESLKNIRNHNQAMQEATSEALLHILRAFSPDVLLSRFNNYKRCTDIETTSPDAWAWSMYKSYFEELTSNRQSGFDKLFWEVFEQSYDKKIREMQMES